MMILKLLFLIIVICEQRVHILYKFIIERLNLFQIHIQDVLIPNALIVQLGLYIIGEIQHPVHRIYSLSEYDIEQVESAYEMVNSKSDKTSLDEAFLKMYPSLKMP